MREIKFRAWIKEEEIMTYFEDESYILNGDMSVDAFDYEKSDCKNYFEPCYRTVDAEIMQFTGLHDKNGKEIYEGDIVEIDKDVAKTFDIYSKGIINYLNGGFIVTKNDGSYETIKSALLILGDLNNIFRGKVIGNIYENPDLLKGDIV